MGTLFSALGIGRTGLQVSQIQLDTAGHNIANVNREGFSRQRVDLTTRIPNIRPYGSLGRGPAVDSIERIRDVFLDTVYRDRVPGLGQAEVKAQLFNRVEDIFLEPGENGFSNRLDNFYGALNDFANNVESLPVREGLVAETESVTLSLRDLASRLAALRTDANEEVRSLIGEINSLGSRLAEFNRAIFNVELSGQPANDLRDERDVLIDELAQLVNINYRERDNGMIDVRIGADEFVVGRTYREIEGQLDPTIDPRRPDFIAVRYADDGTDVQIENGEIFGALEMRDIIIKEVEDRSDTLARALIEELNGIHGQGRGLTNYANPVTASNAVDDPAAGLNAAGLPFDVQDGSFDVTVYDASGAVAETITVNIDASGGTPTTLNGVAAAIDGAANLGAAVNADGVLTITPDAGFTFRFGNDTAGALTALGVNGLLTGDSAANIALNQDLAEDARLISSGFSLDPAETGDNTAALQMAALRNLDGLAGDSQTINEFYESTVTQVGIDALANNQLREVETAFVEDFNARRQEVSGVSIDEEVTNLILYQRAFEASARIITVTDRMLETLLGIVG